VKHRLGTEAKDGYPHNIAAWETLIEQHFPIPVVMRQTPLTLLELREWLWDHVGFSTQDTWMDPRTFGVRAVSVDTDAKWCYYKDRQFRFKNPEEAILFKLTHGGSSW
jgi:hypothetical protein